MPALDEIREAWQRLLDHGTDDEAAMGHFRACCGDLLAAHEQARQETAEAAKGYFAASARMGDLTRRVVESITKITEGGSEEDYKVHLAEQALVVTELLEALGRLVQAEQRLAQLANDIAATNKLTGG